MRFNDNNWENGKDSVKNLSRQKSCMGEGGERERERERVLDDAFGN